MSFATQARTAAAPGTRPGAGRGIRLPFVSADQLVQAHEGGTRFALHYHARRFDVTQMVRVGGSVYVEPPCMPVQVFPDGSSSESSEVWLEKVA